ncbi:MAG: uncharacterized membrane protein YgdD (TMEM256/DUF423 family) [Verrucomicrobiales bacterium]|jgi:uncharacterized membrane protein YgdD (TMEM256/DUF423 family)
MNLARLSAIIAFLAIAIGAFGAHAFEQLLEKNGKTDTFRTATLYHLVHAVALFALAWRRENPPKGPWIAIAIGILLFSGSLYALSLTNIGVLGAITPLGGVSFLIGWLWLAIKPG